MLGSVNESIFGAYIRAYMAASVPSRGIRSVLQGTLGSVLENVLGGEPGNILEVYLKVS